VCSTNDGSQLTPGSRRGGEVAKSQTYSSVMKSPSRFSLVQASNTVVDVLYVVGQNDVGICE
jgi:hypothetical protein